MKKANSKPVKNTNKKNRKKLIYGVKTFINSQFTEENLAKAIDHHIKIFIIKEKVTLISVSPSSISTDILKRLTAIVVITYSKKV